MGAYRDLQSVSGWEPSRQVSSCMQTEGSAPYEKPAQIACSTSAYASFPRYCPLLMRIVGKMNTYKSKYSVESLPPQNELLDWVWTQALKHFPGACMYNCTAKGRLLTLYKSTRSVLMPPQEFAENTMPKGTL